MKIVDVETVPVSCPLEEPLRWGSFVVSVRGASLVRVLTDEGITGIGEAGFSVNFHPTVSIIIQEKLKPLVMGRDPFDIELLWEEMFKATHSWGRRGMETYAISGVEIALWDIIGKACNKPVYKLLGGYRDRVRAYWAPSLKEPSVVAKECEGAATRGFTAIKVRVGLGLERDVEIVKAAREVVGDRVDLMVDANMAYSYRTAVKMARAFEEYNVLWLEEPIFARSVEEYVREHARLAAAVDVPIAGGECLFTKYEFGDLLTKRAVDIVQPDSTGVGGISECLELSS